MNKQRLEAFSDGVFAIAITLLVLDIRLPEIDYTQFSAYLPHLLPNFLSYIMSFIVIGLYWIFHHQYTDRLTTINRPFLFLNLLNLLIISFMPFPTSLLGRFPFSTIPMLIYGLTLMAANVTGFLTLLYLTHHEELSGGVLTKAYLRRQYPIYIIVNGSYLIGFAFAFFYPLLSFAIYAGVLALLLIRTLKTTELPYCLPRDCTSSQES